MSFIKHVKSRDPKPDRLTLQRKLRNEAVSMSLARLVLSDAGVGVPELYSISSDDTHFEMELIEGTNLLNLIETNRIGVDQVNKIRSQLKEALYILHSHGISHGDLYPRNIIIDNQERVWLVDFEMARINHNKYEMNRDIKVLDSW